jgi:histidine triad (HIT) family protein
MNPCVFCEIAAGRAPASVVHRDEGVLAFLDISPVNPGHVLVIPVAHATYLADLDPAVAGSMFQLAQRLAAALRRSGLKSDGVNMYLADGAAGGQEVFHVHLHVFPRFVEDGFGLKLGPLYGNKPERSELDRLAESIRQAMSEQPAAALPTSRIETA